MCNALYILLYFNIESGFFVLYNNITLSVKLNDVGPITVTHSKEIRISKSTFSKRLLAAILDFRFRPGFEKKHFQILEEEGPRNSNQVSKSLPAGWVVDQVLAMITWLGNFVNLSLISVILSETALRIWLGHKPNVPKFSIVSADQSINSKLGINRLFQIQSQQ